MFAVSREPRAKLWCSKSVKVFSPNQHTLTRSRIHLNTGSVDTVFCAPCFTRNPNAPAGRPVVDETPRRGELAGSAAGRGISHFCSIPFDSFGLRLALLLFIERIKSVLSLFISFWRRMVMTGVEIDFGRRLIGEKIQQKRSLYVVCISKTRIVYPSHRLPVIKN